MPCDGCIEPDEADPMSTPTPDPECAAGELACDGAVLLRCRYDGQGFEAISECVADWLCEESVASGSAECRPCSCALGETRCNGSTLERCSEPCRFEPLEQCETAGLCNAGGGECLTPVCDGGAFRCNGATIERCNDDRTEWQAVSVCASAGVCQLSLNSGGDFPQCVACGCQVAEMRCNGARLERCDDACAFHVIEECEAPELCDAPGAECLPARPGDAGVP
jgi:hypothetical protein